MKGKTSKNLQLNLFITVITGILGFVSNKYFSNYLGMQNLGLMKLFSQMIAYLSLADLGIASAATFSLYKPLSEKNYLQLSVIISTINFFYKRIALIILTIGLVLNLLLKFLIEGETLGLMLYIYWSLYVINTSISYTFAKYPIIFTANQEYRFVRTVSGLIAIISQIVQIFFLVITKSFLVYILINIFNNAITYYFYNRHYKNNYKYIIHTSEKDRDVMKNIKNMFWHKVSGLIVSNTDYIVLAKFTTLSVIAKYSSYMTIYMMLLMLIGIITSVMTPIIGKYIVMNEKEDIYRYWLNLYSVYMFLGTVAIYITYNLINPFIELWLGSEYVLPKLTVVLIMINLFVSLTRPVTDTFKDCSGFFEDTYTPIIESIINLSISLLLVQKIGLDGVILGTIFSNIIVIYFLKPILVFKKCFNKSAFDYLKKLSKYLGFNIVSILIIDKINLNLEMSREIFNWMDFMKLLILKGGSTILITLLVFLFDCDFRKYILKIIKNVH